VAARVDGFYVAFDLDALDAGGGWAVAMPEPGGLSLETAVRSVRAIASAAPVLGFGATAVLVGRSGDAERTADAVATLTEAALG
jgi:arginase family enzyme